MDIIYIIQNLILSTFTGGLYKETLMTITLDFWQLLSMFGSAVTILCGFLVWGVKSVTSATQKWSDVTSAVKSTQEDLATIVRTIEAIENDREETKSDIREMKTQMSYMQTQFIQRMEILETLKRTEQFFTNIVMQLQTISKDKINVEMPDLQSPIMQRQQSMDDNLRRMKI